MIEIGPHAASASPSKGRRLLLAGFFACLWSLGLAQPSSDATFTISNSGTSDYALTLNWTYNSSYCDCSQSTNLSVSCSQSGGNNIPANCGLPTSFSGSPGSSSYTAGPGQSVSIDWTFNYSGRRQWTGDGCTVFATCLVDCSCDYDFSGTGVTGSTVALKQPTGVSATDGTYDTKVVITWSKGTNIPDNLHQYRIYRNGSLIATVGGSNRSYENTGLSPGQSYTYGVTTYVPSSSFGATHETAQVTNDGSTFSVGLVASDGDYSNRTKLSWNDLSDVADEIRVERSVPGTSDREELDILSGSARAYNDQDGIPGYGYTYYVTPLDNGTPWLTGSDGGYSKPNGKISGHVKSQLNAGVSGVDIQVELLDTITASPYPLPNCTRTYCATTDAEGYYEIKDIYYYTGAEFRIIPFKSGTIPHDFTPDSLTRTLDETTKSITGADFTDLTVFTVGGRVTYPTSPNNVTCGVEGARILVDGQDYGILTDDNGDWTFAIQDEDTYTFEVVYLHHQFEDGNGDSLTSLLIQSDSLSIDFEDTETDDLLIIVQGGCEASLGDSVEVHVTAPGNCFDEYYVTDVNGILFLEDMPARDYSVEVTEIFDMGNPNISNIMAQIGNIPIEIDLTVRDTAEVITETDTTIITPEVLDTLPNGAIIVVSVADTTETTLYDTSYTDVAPMVRFIYRSPLVITTDWTEAGAMETSCTDSEGDPIVLVEQANSYIVTFEVKELLGDCYIDTGFLKIYDFVSDREGDAILVPIQGGIATYQIDAGEPLVSTSSFRELEKLLYVIPEVDLIDPE